MNDYTPKTLQERLPTGLGYIISPPANFIRERKQLKYKGSVFQQRPTTVKQKLTAIRS